MMSSFKIWAIENQSLLTSVAAVSVFIFFLSLLSLPWVVSKIPKDYFIRNTNRFEFWREKFPSSWLIIIIIKILYISPENTVGDNVPLYCV